jgi:hypothetical protein
MPAELSPTASASPLSLSVRARLALGAVASIALGLSLASFQARWRALDFSGHDLAFFSAQGSFPRCSS